MTPKKEVLALLKTLPDSVRWEDISYHIYIHQRVLGGLADAKTGQVARQQGFGRRLSRIRAPRRFSRVHVGDSAAARLLRDFEERAGVRIPAGMYRFFSARRELKYLARPSLRRIVALSSLYPAVPARVLPVFDTHCGSILGLYFPRGRRGCFVVGFDHEESILFPLSRDPEALFRDPDRFSHDHPDNHDTYPPKDWDACRGLLVDEREAKVPELELLKPLCFHYRDLEMCNPELFGVLVSRFGSPDARAKRIAEAFPCVKDLLDRRRWISLASWLVAHAYHAEAMLALENCLTLFVIDPFHGDYGGEKEDRHWSKTLEVLRLVKPLLRGFGGSFDRVTYAHQVRVATRWASSER